MSALLHSVNWLLRSWFPVSPPWLWVSLALFTVAIMEAIHFLSLYAGTDALVPLRAREGFILFAVATAGYFRVYYAHPLYQTDYACWLTLTPWTSARSLPFAPICLTVQDVLVATIPALLLHDRQLPWPYFPLAFLGGWMAPICRSFFQSGMRTYGYATVFGTGLVIRLTPWPEIALLVGAAVYLLASFGVQAWLAQFPRPFWPYDAKVPAPVSAGWPFAELSPHFEDPYRKDFGTWTHAPIGLAAGWLLYSIVAAVLGELGWAVMAKSESQAGDQLSFLVLYTFVFAGLAALIRLVIYAADAEWPIDPWGRLFTGRWIVPGFDIVLVTPLAIALVPPGLVLLLVYFNAPIGLTVGMGVATAAVLFTCGPPSWTMWRLTGDYRLAANPKQLQQHAKEL